MTSPLAAVVASRGQRLLAPRGLLVHVTGSGLAEQAARAKADLEEFAVSFYAVRSPHYPHYLISRDGDCYAFCSEERRAAHAAWRPWEVRLYAETRDNRWRTCWARDFMDDVTQVEPSFYAGWTNRWDARGLDYKTPHDILVQLGAPVASPNSCFIGVEMLSSLDSREPLTDAQIDSLAALFVDCARRNEWLDPSQIEPSSLPQAWLCSHSDLSPCRRWQRTKADRKRGPTATPREGFAFDPPASALDWRALSERIIRVQ